MPAVDVRCEGCGLPGATVERWYPSSWGSRPVALHEAGACGERARDRLGGREWLSEQDARLLAAMKGYAAWLRDEWKRASEETRAS